MIGGRTPEAERIRTLRAELRQRAQALHVRACQAEFERRAAEAELRRTLKAAAFLTSLVWAVERRP